MTDVTISALPLVATTADANAVFELQDNVGDSFKITGSLLWKLLERTIGGTVTTISSSAGTVTVDCSLGNFYTLQLTENVTSWTFTNVPAGLKIQIQIKQDTTVRTVSWPALFDWPNGVVGSVSTTANAVDLLELTTLTGGVNFLVNLNKNFS
jgi:hypothetical protein